MKLKNEGIMTWFIALLPLLSVCRSPVPGVDLGTLLAIVVAMLCFSSSGRLYIKKKDPFNFFVLFILLTTLLNSIAVDSVAYSGYATTTTTFMRLGKLLVVVGIFISLDFIRFVNVDSFFSAISKIVCVNTAFILIQRLSYQAVGRSVANPLSIVATSDAYNSSQYTMLVGSQIRPSGFFFEPAHYAQFCVLYLCYLLFGQRKLDIKKLLIVSVGIIITGSGLGILMLFGLLSAYLLIRFNKNTLRTIFYALGLIVAVQLLLRTEFMQTVLGRLTDGTRTGGNAIEARIGNGYSIFSNLSLSKRLFGCGYGRVPNDVYLNGITYLLNTLGIVGVLLFSLVLIHIARKAPRWGRWVIGCFAALLFGAQMFTAASLVFYLGLPIVASYDKEEKMTYE